MQSPARSSIQWKPSALRLIKIHSRSSWTRLPLIFSQSAYTTIANKPMQMAAAAMVCLPCLVLFFIFRDKMIGNLTMGGIKG